MSLVILYRLYHTVTESLALMNIYLHSSSLGARFSKVPKTFLARKAIRKTPTAYSVKLVFSLCFKGNENLNNCKVSCLKTPSFKGTKRIMSPEMRPKRFGTFEKRAPGVFKVLIQRETRKHCTYDRRYGNILIGG